MGYKVFFSLVKDNLNQSLFYAKQVIESIFLKGYSYNVVIGALDRRYSSIKEIEKRALNKLIVFLGSKEEKNSQINYSLINTFN